MKRNAGSSSRGRQEGAQARARPAKPGMEHSYLVTFPAGLTDLVTQCLQSDLKQAEFRYSDDSAVIVATTSPSDQVARLGYVKNAFQILLETPRSSLKGAARSVIRILRQDLPAGMQGLRGFRLMAQMDGQLESFDRHTRNELEQAVRQLTGAPVNARGGGDELWLIGRRELTKLVLARRISCASRSGPKGSLGPELSELLVRLSRPTAEDVFLDPFSGSGSLPRARAQFPAKRIVSSDLYVKPTLTGAKNDSRIEVLNQDARELESIPNEAVNAIVTDPPWGEFEELAGGNEHFYDLMAESFARVLTPVNGRVVILISRHSEKELTDAFIRHGFLRRERISIVLNGHPAVVLRLDRRGEERVGQ